MNSASTGSRPNPHQFLEGYAGQVEEGIRALQAARMPAEGDYALHGKEGQDVKAKAEAGVIKV